MQTTSEYCTTAQIFPAVCGPNVSTVHAADSSG